jgi:2-methylcitrate dehydratase PrpD
MSAMTEFARTASATAYAALPLQVAEETKKQILDTFAANIAGSMSADVRKFADFIKEWGGKSESTIIGCGGKVPCANAALVNGFTTVVLDYDGFHDIDFVSTPRGVIPAALALAERRTAVHGKEFITAVAVGIDIGCRLARAALVHRESPFMEVPAYFGSAAAAAKVLNLGEEGMRNALGLCLMHGYGMGNGISEALNVKGYNGGVMARAGVMSALMAEDGFDGLSDTIEHPSFGFYSICHHGLYRPWLLTPDLGKTFEVSTNGIKPYPCCRFNHIPIQATLALVNEHDIKPEDVEAVTVQVGPASYKNCEPVAEKRRPRNAIHTQHSIPWSVASAIVHRKVTIEEHTEEAIHNPVTLEVAQKVHPKINPELKGYSYVEPAIVEIETRDGRVFSKRLDGAHGSSEDPMSFAEVADKFRYCCGFSNMPISKENQEKIIRLVEHLEDVDDVGRIASLLG